MRKIGLLSDTHAYLHPGIYKFFKDVDEIWHCGDIGNADVYNELETFKPLKAVSGNVDGFDVRILCPEFQLFKCEDVKVLITHIGGYPGKYDMIAKNLIITEKPKLFLCGHSHILKVIYDKKYQLLHINPGASGKYGIHKVITLVRFEIEGDNISNLEIGEFKKH